MIVLFYTLAYLAVLEMQKGYRAVPLFYYLSTMRNYLLLLCMMGFASIHAQTGDGQDRTELQGGGTADNPYLIQDEFDLRIMQQKIDKNMQASNGKYYRLTADIHLNGKILNEDGTLAADTTQLTKWEPIGRAESSTWSPSGSSYAFKGNFDGNGHTIYGIYINDSTSNNSKGLFGCIHEGGVVHHLNVADSYIVGTQGVGAIAGQCYNGLIEDCESKATVTGVGTRFYAGGIAGIVSGYNGKLKHCTNSGSITGHSKDWWMMGSTGLYPGEGHTGGVSGYVSGAIIDSCLNTGFVVTEYRGEVGGIAGQGGGTVRASVNKGTVTALVQESIGGIVGLNSKTVTGCRNEGQVIATTKGSSVGGIVGISSFSPSIYNSVNVVDISSDIDSVFVGGIIGNMDGGYDYYNGYKTPKVYNSVNYGDIRTTQPKSQAGGISGRTYCGEIYNSGNYGHIVSESLAGGITPSAEYHSCIKGSFNTGRVEGRSSTGGIVGYTNESVDDCWNNGTIRTLGGNSNAGGIAGYLSGSSGYVFGCINTGEICNAGSVAGIIGYNNYSTSTGNCYNAGFIHSEADGARVGGIGAGNGSVSNSYNTGIISVSGTGSTACGITHNLWSSYDSHGNYSGARAENCYNMGHILVMGSDCRAGNVASAQEGSNAAALCRNCYYLENAIEGNSYTATDESHKNLTPLAEEDFRTLADKINKKEWDWDPNPFIQGYYRPVLQCTRNLLSKHYFEVTTYEGDTVFIDLGAPMDNTIFLTDTTGLVLDAYNVLLKDTIRNAMLIDEKDFRLQEPAYVQQLIYSRKASTGWGAACLPFDVSVDDMPNGCVLTNPLQIKNDGQVLTEMQNEAQAGHPFFFFLPDSTTEWTIEKQNVNIVPEPANTALMTGVFCASDVWDGCCYLPAEEKGVLLLAQPTDSIKAFRAYIQTPEPTFSSLSLSDATGLKNTTEMNNNVISMSYDVDGRRINKPQRGLNIIRMSDGTAKKVMVK